MRRRCNECIWWKQNLKFCTPELMESSLNGGCEFMPFLGVDPRVLHREWNGVVSTDIWRMTSADVIQSLNQMFFCSMAGIRHFHLSTCTIMSCWKNASFFPHPLPCPDLAEHGDVRPAQGRGRAVRAAVLQLHGVDRRAVPFRPGEGAPLPAVDRCCRGAFPGPLGLHSSTLCHAAVAFLYSPVLYCTLLYYKWYPVFELFTSQLALNSSQIVVRSVDPKTSKNLIYIFPAIFSSMSTKYEISGMGWTGRHSENPQLCASDCPLSVSG